MLTIGLNMYHAVALGAFLSWLGGVITDKVSLLSRYCIPAPLVGGLCFSILNCILYSMGIASINFDATLQTVFMIMFFTTVGFTVSIPALLKGGKAVILCLAISIVMIPLQNFLGGGVMALFGRDPLLGIGCGSIALVGGPGTAAAFGPDLEAAGVVGGSVVSIAAATFGLVAGSLMGGPTAKRLIEKHDLRPAPVTAGGTTPSAALATDVASEDERFISDSPRFVKGFMLLLLAVGIGNQVSVWLTALTGLTFRAYIGAMLVAVVVLYPWCYRPYDANDPKDAEIPFMKETAAKMAQVYQDYTGRGFYSMSSNEDYATSAEMIDYSFGRYNIHSYTIEVYSPGKSESGDINDCMWENNMPEAKWVFYAYDEIQEKLGLDPAAITDEDGNKLAANEGLWFYTSSSNQMVNDAPEEQDVMVRGCRDAILTMIHSEPNGDGYQNPGFYK